MWTHTHADGLEHAHPDQAPSPQTGGWGRWLGLVLLLGLCSLLAARTVFFVDEAEYVYVTQFGHLVRLHAVPGLQVKWPYQSLWRFDRRLQIIEPPGRELLTEDKENLNFEWYVCWQIAGATGRSDTTPESTSAADVVEPHVRRFWQSLGTLASAEGRLEERIQAALAAEIGQTQLTQLVSLRAEDVALSQLAERVQQQVAAAVRDQFGIEVVDVRIKKFSYPDAVKPAVFAEIRSERERVAVQYRAEGASQKARLESLATLQRDQLLAQARREATRIRGEGEAKAIEIANAAQSRNPEFYEFLQTLDTYRKVLDEQTTLVLSADSPLLQLLTRGLGAPPRTNFPVGTPAEANALPDSPAPAAAASSPAADVPAEGPR